MFCPLYTEQNTQWLFIFFYVFVCCINEQRPDSVSVMEMHAFAWRKHIYINVSSEIFTFKDFGCVYIAKTDIIS